MAACRFAGASVVARVLSAVALECASPLPGGAGYVQLEVSMNGQDFSSEGVQFEYQPAARVRALEPLGGPVEGGTFVNVTGSGFSERASLLGYARCRFNQMSVGATRAP